MSCIQGVQGDQIGKVDYLEKYKCKDWKHAPDGDMSVNFILPANKGFDHCDLEFYTEHNCEGDPFLSQSPLPASMTAQLANQALVIYGADDSHGNSSSQTFNAQSHCIETANMKSFSIPRCT
jgi:hypothetical protein